jgi:pimeloyl-ACP methyl ester carboxylesterase
MQVFLALTGLGAESRPQSQPSPEMQEALARMQRNVEFFLAHYMLPIATYVPDTATLQAASSRVVVAVGEASRGQLAHDTALALAERLETKAVTFPGGHSGFLSHPAAFAQKLHEVLWASVEAHAT